MFERGGVAVRAEPGDVVIDAGACFGDTSLMFADAVGPGGQVHAFEPVPAQAEVVERNLALNPRLKERLVLHRLGLADRPGEARFSDAGAGAQQSATGGVLVRLTTIDSIVEEHGIAPSFIKMDIEGAESAALRGAAGTLRRHRPKLAISAYHSLDDLVGLAPLIHSLEPGYRFHLDHHTTHSEETVLYAVAS